MFQHHQMYSYSGDFSEGVVFAFCEGRRVLIEHRPNKSIISGEKETFFTNGSIEIKDHGQEEDYKITALKREIHEEFEGKVIPKQIDFLGELKVPEINTLFYVYLISNWEGSMPSYTVEEGKKFADLEWIDLNEQLKYFKYNSALEICKMIEKHLLRCENKEVTFNESQGVFSTGVYLLIDEANQIFLRELCEEDSHKLFRAVDDNRDYLKKWLPWVESTVSYTDSLLFIRNSRESNRKKETLILSLWEKDELIGTVSLVTINKETQSAYLGDWIIEQAQGRGLITNSSFALLDYAFSFMNIIKININYLENNVKSMKVAGRIGFKPLKSVKTEYLENGNLILTNEIEGTISVDFWNKNKKLLSESNDSYKKFAPIKTSTDIIELEKNFSKATTSDTQERNKVVHFSFNEQNTGGTSSWWRHRAGIFTYNQATQNRIVKRVNYPVVCTLM